MDFKTKNRLSFEFSQFKFNEEKRDRLVNLISSTAYVTKKHAQKVSPKACKYISILLAFLFSDQNKKPLEVLSNFLFTKNICNVNKNCYMNLGYAATLNQFQKFDLVPDRVKMLDYDIRYEGQSGEYLIEQIYKRLEESPKSNIVVCFGQSWSNNHAMIICNDDEGNVVVLDTSNRSHEYPDNLLERHVNKDNILYWIEYYI